LLVLFPLLMPLSSFSASIVGSFNPFYIDIGLFSSFNPLLAIVVNFFFLSILFYLLLLVFFQSFFNYCCWYFIDFFQAFDLSFEVVIFVVSCGNVSDYILLLVLIMMLANYFPFFQSLEGSNLVVQCPHVYYLDCDYNLACCWTNVMQPKFTPMQLHGSICKPIWKSWWKWL
jgi:hypothetical protein